MLFSRQLSLASLTELCRTLRHNLDAGLGVREVFKQIATRGGKGLRPLADRVFRRLDHGQSLEDALAEDNALFPPLFITMAIVGERTGHLPEVFRELETYFQLQLRLRRQFLAQAMLPAIQFIIAAFIVAIVIFVLGMIGSAPGMKPITLFGLSGPIGALVWLAGNAVAVACVYGLVVLVRRQDWLLLRLPVIGPCLRAFALARFALALQLTLDSDLPIDKAVRLSLEAAGSRAFAREADRAVKSLKRGESLTAALAPMTALPEDFKDLAAMGEEAGNLPEVLRRRAEHLHEEAGLRQATLVKAAGFLIWLVYGAFMVALIFRIFGIYLGMFELIKV